MTTRRKRILVAITSLVVAILAIVLAARAVLPNWLRGKIERVVGEAIGRDLNIDGAFDISLSRTATLVAGEVTLANVSWGSEPYMVRAERVEITVDLASLWSGPVRFRDVVLHGARVLLERDRDGRTNWTFEMKPALGPPSIPPGRPPVTFEHASVRDFAMVYRPPADARPTTVGIDELDASVDRSAGMIDVKGGGRFNEAPWDIAGRIGSPANVVSGRNVDLAMTGHIGQSALSISGDIHDPLTLGGPNVEVSVDGPEVAAAMAVFGLRSPLTGPFRAHAVLAPANGDVGIELTASVGEVSAKAKGTLAALLDPSRLDATIALSGPDASVVGSWCRVAGLPRRPFDLSGRFRRNGPRLACDGVEVRVGGTSLALSGTLGTPPRFVGADLQVAANGSNLGELSALTRLPLPADAFEIHGRFLRRADALAIDGVEARVGGTSIHAAGTIGEPPRLESLDLTVDGVGPDASKLSGIAGVELPVEPFELRGRVARSGSALQLYGVAGRLGDVSFEAGGRLVPVRGLVGTEGKVQLAGDDLAKIASLAGVNGLPAQPFRVVGHVAVLPDGYDVEDVDAQVGSLVAVVDGRVGAPSPFNGTALACRVRGSALSDLAVWGIEGRLPADPFGATGGLRIDGGVYRVDGVTAEVGANRVEVDGTLGAIPDVSALDIAVTAAGPSLASVVHAFTAPDALPPERLPEEAYTLSGRLRRVPSGLAVHEMKATVGTASMSAEGTLIFQERMLGTDVTLDIEAPDTAMLSRLIGTSLPEQRVHARGRIVRNEQGLLFDNASVTLGPTYAEASGTLGAPPRFAHTDLNVSVEGPDLAAMLGPMTGLAPLPVESFELSAHVHGSNERITSEGMTARLGNTDVEGSISVALGKTPFVDADLRSKNIDIADLVAGFTRTSDAGEEPAKPGGKTRRKKEKLIPDQPLSLGALRHVDGHLALAAASVAFPGVPLHDVEIDGDLRDGAVTIERFEGTGEHGGRASGRFFLETKDDGYRVRAEGRLDGGRLVLPKSEESPASAPSVDLEYDVSGTGKSLHEIAASSEGWALLILGPGRIPNTLGSFVSSDVLLSLMDALNPFRKSSPYTEFECGVAAAGIRSGKAVVEPIATRTDKLTVVGNGKLDFNTEAIDLVWTLKPRRGIGLSGSTIVNPFIKLGGTLASPALDLKPVQAAVSTGAAVATAGLTLLFRGIYDRITAEKKVCANALAKARKRIDRATREEADGTNPEGAQTPSDHPHEKARGTTNKMRQVE